MLGSERRARGEWSTASACGAVLALAVAVGGCEPPPPPPPPDDRDTHVKPAAFEPAEVPEPPQVIDLGGEVLATPRVAMLYFAGEPLQDIIDPFVAELQPAGFWTPSTSEYGVGPLTVSPALHFADAAPSSLTGDELITQMDDAFTSGAFGAPDPSTIYTAVIPSSTAFDDFGTCCGDFDGEHFAASAGGATIPIAVVCACDDGFAGPGLGADDELTATIAHELAEAATDPFDDPAFAETDDAHIAWTLASGGEVGDMCDLSDNASIVLPGMEHAIQRIWSNQAALVGADPCVPAPAGAVYFQSVPVLEDDLVLNIDGVGTVHTLGKKLDVGQTGTIEVKLSSSADTEAWTVTPLDASFGQPQLDLRLDKRSGNNGDTLVLTVTLNAVDPDIGAALFFLESSTGNPSAPSASSASVGLVGPS